MAKMEISKLMVRGAFLTFAGMIATTALATEASMDGSNSAVATTFETAQNGRALLKPEDLKRLLGMDGKNPASNDSVTFKDGPFALDFSKREVSAIHRRIVQIEREREVLHTKLLNDFETQKGSIRTQRREIQASRLSARSTDDQRLSKSLYENILKETNLDSQIKRQLEDFDRSHLVSIDFMHLKGQRYVQSISIGPREVWALQNGISVAKK